MICWFADKKTLKPRGRFHLRHTTNEVRAVVTDVLYKVNISTLEKSQSSQEFTLNDIGCVRIRCAAPIFFDSYNQNRTTGSFVLVDEQTNNTVAAGMILKPLTDLGDEDAERWKGLLGDLRDELPSDPKEQAGAVIAHLMNKAGA